MTYFISKALTENGYVQEAFDNNLQYYGGMLQMGATSFWEGFEVEWMENDKRERIDVANHAAMTVYMPVSKPVTVGAMLRKKR